MSEQNDDKDGEEKIDDNVRETPHADPQGPHRPTEVRQGEIILDSEKKRKGVITIAVIGIIIFVVAALAYLTM